MRAVRWACVLAVLTAGCQPADVDITVRSPERLDLSVQATVPAADEDLCLAFVERLQPGRWRVRRTLDEPYARLLLTRRLDPRNTPAVEVTDEIVGPLRLRRLHTLRYQVDLGDLPEDHPLRSALAAVDVTVRVAMPGRVIAEESNAAEVAGGLATWNVKLDGKPLELQAQSVAWRGWLLGFWAVVLAGLIYVAAPALTPPPEVRERRRAARARRRDAKAARRAEQAATAAERKQQAAEARAAKADRQAAARAAKQAAADARRRATAKPAPEPAPPVAEVAEETVPEPAGEMAAEPAEEPRKRGLFRRGSRKPPAAPRRRR